MPSISSASRGKASPVKAFKRRDDLIPWFTELLDALKITKANLAGQSYGGWFALNYALHMPERVQQDRSHFPCRLFPPPELAAYAARVHDVLFPHRARR